MLITDKSVEYIIEWVGKSDMMVILSSHNTAAEAFAAANQRIDRSMRHWVQCLPWDGRENQCWVSQNKGSTYPDRWLVVRWRAKTGDTNE